MASLSHVNIILRRMRDGSLPRRTALQLLYDLNSENNTEDLSEIIYLIESKPKLKAVKNG